MPFWGQKMRKATAALFDLPQDVVHDVPRITMIGTLQMVIENHRGVAHFSETKLHLHLPDGGTLQINGRRLKIRAIYDEEVLIEGFITGVAFDLGEGEGV